MELHPTSQIDPSARIGQNVVIGPFAWIGANTIIGDNVHIFGWCFLGAEGIIYPHRGKRFHGILEIESGAIIREHATIHRGFSPESKTIIGEGAYIMDRAHIGHDAQIGRHAIISTGAIIGGHTIVGPFTWIGLNATLHQRIEIGESSIIGMGSVVRKDIPPFSKAFGVPAKVVGPNELGIRRRFFENYYEL